MKRGYQGLWLAVTLGGCASGAAVRGDGHLPVRSVVLYRSGVGYFEREGSFSGSELAFGVKQREVGDFLSSLTAVERGSGSVTSISFDVPEAKPAPAPPEDGEAPSEEPDDEEQRVEVKLHLSEDKTHELHVAYVVGSPIWRPSYRVLFDKGQDALLQAWAVVQNTSGEDWRNVQLALTTGAPISFRSDLGTPITPERPLVTDSGEVVTSVPVGETALANEPPPPPAPVEAPMAEQLAYDKSDAESDEAPAQSSARAELKKQARPSAKPAAPAMKIQAERLEQAVATQATAAVLSGSVTRYDIARPVTIPNGGSTMVAIVSKRIHGERAHLYAPDDGVQLSRQHPFSVARFENGTGAVLEKGPISVLADGAFLGQGVLDSLPSQANAFVPFALDKSIVVERSESYTQEQGALVRISHGIVTVQRFSQRKTRYGARNGSDEPSKLYVRHARWDGAELVAPPKGTELVAQKALVPMEVPKKGERALEVVERTPIQVDFSFIDQPAADAVALWLSGPAGDAAQGATLKRALELRTELVKHLDEMGGLEREQAELQNASNETRQNLKAIEKVKTAQDLRKRLLERLNQLDGRLAEITKRLIEARTRQSELQVRLNEALDSVTLELK